MKNVSVNHQPSLSAESSITNENENVYSTNHALDVNISGSAITGDVNLTEVGGAAVALGQTTMSASLPVTIASNQSALPVSQSGTWNINNISGTISLPTNAAMETGGNLDYLLGIDTNTSAISAAMTDGSQKSQIVDGSGNVIGSTSNALNVNISSGNITGFATASNQTSGAQLTQIVDAGGDAVTVTGGKLDVNATISGSGGGTSSIDKAAFTIGSDTGTPVMGIYQSSLDTISNGTVAVAGLTPKRGLFVNLQTASGTETGVAAVPLQVSLANTASNSTAVKVDGTGGSFPISGTVAATQSGTWTVQPGNTANTTPWLVTGSGTAGTAAAGVLTIQGIASMTPVQVSQATASNLNATVVQGTATNLKTAATLYNSSGTEIGTTTNPVAVQPPASGYLATNLTHIAGNAVSAGNGASGTGVLRVTVANDSTGVIGLNAGTNSIGKISDITTSIVPGTGATNLGKAEDAAHTDGDTGVFVLSRRIDAQASSAGSTGDYAAFNTDSAGGVYVTPSANAGVIGTAIYNNTALSSTKQAVNASAGNLYGYHIYNPNGVVIYIQLFNLASASVTIGSTSPTAVIAVPPLGWADATPATPISFSTALTIAATTTSTGSGTPTTALLFNAWYK